MDEHNFPIYRRDSITLTISGVGKVASAAAVAYTQAFFGRSESSGWMNIGVAGSAAYAIGTIINAHKIVDRDSDHRWYPPMIGRRVCESAEIVTVSEAETDYNQACVYDMEAAGFYPIATRFSSSELVRCLKVVSDGDEASRDRVTPKKVKELIERQLDTIDQHYLQLCDLAQSSSEPALDEYAEFIARFRFTGQEKIQLAQLLKQWRVLFGKSPRSLKISDLSTGKDVLKMLKLEIELTGSESGSVDESAEYSAN